MMELCTKRTTNAQPAIGLSQLDQSTVRFAGVVFRNSTTTVYGNISLMLGSDNA